MPPQSATQQAANAARANGHRVEVWLQVTELLQRIERADRTRSQLHKVRITNERKARAVEKAFDHDWAHLVAAAAELRESINE
jgi:hypothetical protein